MAASGCDSAWNNFGIPDHRTYRSPEYQVGPADQEFNDRCPGGTDWKGNGNYCFPIVARRSMFELAGKALDGHESSILPGIR